MFTHCLRRIWDIIGGFEQQTIIWRSQIAESNMPNDQAKESQTTKLRIKSTSKNVFYCSFFNKNLVGNLKKVYLMHHKKSQKGVISTRQKFQKGVKRIVMKRKIY